MISITYDLPSPRRYPIRITSDLWAILDRGNKLHEGLDARRDCIYTNLDAGEAAFDCGECRT
jgi:hypothetical protein